MVNPQIVDATAYCQSFPDLSKHTINRPHTIQTIEMAFADGGLGSVSLEGRAGMGKTTTLALYARQHGASTLSLFLSPAARWSYDPTVVILELLAQTTWLLTDEAPSNDLYADQAKLLTAFYKLGLRSSKKGQPYYIVIDGLTDVAQTDPHAVEAITSLLPYGSPAFRFLYSGDVSALPITNPPSTKALYLTPFAPDETVAYLSDVVTNLDHIKELHASCRGIPGYLSSVRRLIESGIPPQTLIDDVVPDHLAQLFDLEWSRLELVEHWHTQLLAILAFDTRTRTYRELSSILKVPDDALRRFVESAHVLRLDNAELVTYVSDLIRRVAAVKLSHLRIEAIRLVIQHLSSHPGHAATAQLPEYYAAVDQVDDLLNFLSPSHFSKALASTESLSTLRRHAEVGYKAASSSDRVWDAVRFVLHKGTILESGTSAVTEAEIRAHAALKSVDSALQLARTSSVKERRFRSLAVALSSLSEHAHIQSSELIAELKRLYADLDVESLGEDAMDIGTSLIDVAPDIAFDIVDKAAGSHGDRHAIDMALVRFAIATEDPSRHDRGDVLGRVHDRIANPKLREATKMFSSARRSVTAADVLLQTARIEDGVDRIFCLRMWLSSNQRRDDALDVVQQALAEAIKASEFSLTAAVLREFARPLPFASDLPRVKELVGLFDAQRAGAERLGPTEELVRLQLILAKAEAAYDGEAASIRLTEVYIYIDTIKDPSVRAAAMARVLAALADVDPGEAAKEGQSHSIEAELMRLVEQSLEASAYQGSATKNVISALATTHIHLAMKVAASLNREDRRDDAYLDIVLALVKVPLGQWNLTAIDDAIGQIRAPYSRDESVHAVSQALRLAPPTDASSTSLAISRLLMRARQMRAAYLRAASLSNIFAVASSVSSPEPELVSTLRNDIQASIDAITSIAERTDASFSTAAALAEAAPDLSKALIDAATQLRGSTPLLANGNADSCRDTLALAIRSYRGLTPRSVDSREDIPRLIKCIEQLPSLLWRAKLLSDLVVTARFSGRGDLCTDIGMQHLRPIIASFGDQDRDYREDAIVFSAPGLYLAHQTDARSWLESIDVRARDRALFAICQTFMSLRPPDEPFERRSSIGMAVRFEDLFEVSTLAGEMTHDGMLHDVVSWVAGRVHHERNRNSLTREQRGALIQALRKAIAERLPSPTGISHEGYRIAAEAQVLRLDRWNRAAWEALRERSRRIPNSPDRALVLAMLAELVPNRDSNLRRELFEEAEAVANRIPIMFERFDRLDSVAERASHHERALAIRIVNTTFKEVRQQPGAEFEKVQRDLIDIAYRLDPELARSLASLADDDQARAVARRGARERLEQLDTKDRLKTARIDAAKTLQRDRERVAAAAWELLGSLNAGTTVPKQMDDLRSPLHVASAMPLSDGFPIVSWIVANIVERYRETEEARRYIRPVFDGAVVTAELCTLLDADAVDAIPEVKAEVEEALLAMIGSGERERAVNVLVQWMTENASDYVKITDPYFGPEELYIVWRLSSRRSDLRFQIVTSERHHKAIPKPWDEQYRSHWRMRVSDDSPPEIDVAIVGVDETEKSPFHDRYWLTAGAALQTGTSANAFGGDQQFAITKVAEDVRTMVELRFDQVLARTFRSAGGSRLRSLIFSI